MVVWRRRRRGHQSFTSRSWPGTKYKCIPPAHKWPSNLYSILVPTNREYQCPTSAAKTASTTAKIPPCIWIAKLIKSIVIKDLLPIALMPMQNQVDDTNNATNNLSGSSNSHRNDDSNNNNTTALEILLSPFLTRMDADESSQIILPPPTSVNSNSERREDADEAISVDDILDRLSGFAIATHNSSNQQRHPPDDTITTRAPLAKCGSSASVRLIGPSVLVVTVCLCSWGA